ncbi:MAG: phytoene/squalene synthase family protein [Deltaproteobacteria bacterium]|nr:phytoene/squalene synthase family protein [Deltaproteobacteria bacterium]
MTDADAIRQCRATLARGSKSFALAGKLLPQPARDYAAVVYTWCRRADDAVDDADPGDQPAALAQLQTELDLIYSSARPTEVTLAAFQDVVRATGIPELYPRELLAGMAMDVAQTRYQTIDDLLLYCYRVASTVGLMMCHVMGLSDCRALDNAAHLGIAMQLTNICRDVAEDWTLGRLYIPEELLEKHGAGELRDQLGKPMPADAQPALATAVRELLSLADRYYQSGDAGLPALPWRCALAIRAARNIYAAIGEELAARHCDVMGGRAVVPLKTKLELVARSAVQEVSASPIRAQSALRLSKYQPPLDRIAGPEDVLPL